MTNQYQAGYKAGLEAAVKELRLFTNAQWYADVIAALPVPDHRNPMAMIDAAIALYREKNR